MTAQASIPQNNKQQCLWHEALSLHFSTLANVDEDLIYWGDITNKEYLRNKLNLSQSAGTAMILAAAYQQWQSACVEHILGDISFVIYHDTDATLLVFRGRQSSYPIYLTKKNQQLHLSDHIATLSASQAASVDPEALFEMTTWGAITGGKTLFKGIEQLNIGDAQTFKLSNSLASDYKESLSVIPSHSWLEQLDENLETGDLETLKADRFDHQRLFNLLPEMSTKMAMPVFDVEQVMAYSAAIEENVDVVSNLGCQSWLNTRVNGGMEFCYDKVSSMLLRHFKKRVQADTYLSKKREELLELYRKEESPIRFDQWFSLKFRVPEYQANLRAALASSGRDIEFAANSVSWQLKALSDDKPSLPEIFRWRLDDAPMQNIYEAMQRLFWHASKPGLSSFIHLAPPMASKVVRGVDESHVFVDRFCLTMLTLDCLFRFNQWSIDEVVTKEEISNV
ncbi:hypothetical protein [Pleionea sp. CnH1-48]|uniref:hypothetical protein n=1 Tax=Pleionea sp. CnH1-48 TaxID=2954494 RepID=UPI002096F1C3|nr:hypothetical protein [Pleionea sp. CnH1-48]MCO7225534.1 hypothetical protein [Pleionea sp. CnH1-48]